MIGPHAASTHIVRLTRREITPAPDLRRWGLAAALTLGGGTHLIVGIQHGLTHFALLSLAAGAAQLALGARVLESSSPVPRRTTLILVLGLLAMWVVNVTTGLPPVITHTHVPGTHQVGGLTLAWPGPIDAEGVVAKITETWTAVSVILLERASRRSNGERSPA